MKKLNLLKTVLDLILLLAIIGSIGITILFVLNISNFKLHFDINELFRINTLKSTSDLTTENSYVEIIRLLIYFYCIYLFRKAIIQFQMKAAFSNEVVQLFNWIGKLILISPFIEIIYDFIHGVIKFLIAVINAPQSGSFSLNPGLDLDFFGDSFLIIMGLGLFFMTLSEVFKTAKEIKEENELTI